MDMMTIKIFQKDKEIPITIHNVEEHYCTEKMFYVRQESGETFYLSLDMIGFIHVIPKNKESNEFVSINEVLEIVERLNHNGSVSVKLLQKELGSLKENK